MAGFHTQSTTVLFERAPSLDAIEKALATWRPTRRPAAKSVGWSGRDSLLVRFDDAQNGNVLIDVMDRPWPDSMGDPKQDTELFGAWTMGAFGPHVFPGNLARACQQAVTFRAATDVAKKHRAFVRLRTLYVIDAHKDAKVFPPSWQPLLELDTMLQLARRVLDLPGALAMFDPNGEVILPRDQVDASLSHARNASIPPLDLFTHVRLFNLAGRPFALMDTVGMERLRLLDAEVLLAARFDPNDGAAFLRNLSLQHVRRGAVILDGQSTEGPGGRYRAQRRAASVVEPPRPIVRFVPEFMDLQVD